jgi:plastocyanin
MRHVIFILSFCLFSAIAKALTVVVTVGNGGNFFSPSSFTINPGDTVRWVWVNGHHNTSGYSLPTGAPSLYGNITSIDTTFEYVPSVSGLYKYTCTHHSGMDGVFFVSGCVYPSKPAINATGNSGCTGDIFILSTPSQAGVTYQWMNGPFSVPFSSSSSLKVNVTGSYKVVVNRCGMDSISDPFPVTIQSPPSASFTYTSNGLHFVFNSSAIADSYLWKFSDGSPAQNTPQANITFAMPGIYTVSLQTRDFTTHCSDSFTTTVSAHSSVGINQPILHEISVYPNPADSDMKVYCPQLRTVIFTDIYGHFYSLPFSKEQEHVCSIKTDQLPEGVYNIKLLSDEGVYNKLVWIQH